MSIRSTVNKNFLDKLETRDYSSMLSAPVSNSGGNISFGEIELEGTNFALIKPKDISGLMSPVDNVRITSPTGLRKANLSSYYQHNGTEVHTGLDFGGNTGDAIKSTASGKVVKASGNGKSNQGLGNYITIEHELNGEKFYSRYAHLNAVKVAVGDSVGAGQVIGELGNTGNSTGAHLHLEVYKQGEGKKHFLNLNDIFL